MARYWLMKSEPETYSIEDLSRDGRTGWDGVRNYQARNLLRDEIQVGDQVLVEASRRLRDGLRGAETVGRLGGDEFIVLVEQVDHPGVPIEIADRVMHSLVAPIPGLEEVEGLSASIGIAMRSPQRDDIEELLLSADEAMYTAKRSGRGRWALATPELEATGDPMAR